MVCSGQYPGTVYDQVTQAGNMNVGSCNIGGCDMGNPNDDGYSPWHHNYTTSQLLSSFIPQASFETLKVVVPFYLLNLPTLCLRCCVN